MRIKVVAAVLLAALCVSGARVGLEVKRVLAAPSPVAGAEGVDRTIDQLPVRIVAGTEGFAANQVLDLNSLENVLILVFGTDCSPCDVNMPNWLDVMADSEARNLDIIAVSLAGRGNLVEYWSPLHGKITVAEADSATLVNANLASTPTTLLLNHGEIRYEYRP